MSKNQQEDKTYVAGLLRRLEMARQMRRYEDLPKAPRDLEAHYFVGSFKVRSHWRRRPNR